MTPALVTTVNSAGQTLRFLMISSPRRLSFLQSLLEPESQKQDWLALALSHDAPQHCDTMTPEGKPRSGLGVCRNYGLCGQPSESRSTLVEGGVLTASPGVTDASCRS